MAMVSALKHPYFKMNVVVFFVLFSSMSVGSRSRKQRKGNVLPEVWNDIAYQYLERESSNPSCQGCAHVRAYLRRPEINLTDIRIELAKQNILKKLGMEKVPFVKLNKKGSLPFPILDGDIFKQEKTRNPLRKNGESAEKVIIMASETGCSMEAGFNLKFNFEIPERTRRSHFGFASMWLYTEDESDSYLSSPCILTAKPCGLLSNIRSNEIYFHTSDIRGWIEKEVSWWLQGNEKCLTFVISCPEDAPNLFSCSQCSEAKKPFLMIEETLDDLSDMFREKRNINCVEGVNECCREKLYVSFSDIGWSDWIIQPKGYEAYYCKGTCLNAAAISLSGTAYHSVLKRLYMTKGQSMGITPCCTPTKLSPVQLIYVDPNGTYIQKTIQDLTVESCGCM